MRSPRGVDLAVCAFHLAVIEVGCSRLILGVFKTLPKISTQDGDPLWVFCRGAVLQVDAHCVRVPYPWAVLYAPGDLIGNYSAFGQQGPSEPAMSFHPKLI